MADVHRRLAYDLDLFRMRNQRTIVRLGRAYWIAAAGLLAEVVFLAAAASDTLT